MNQALHDHFKFLRDADQQAQTDYEKTVLSLSGGALGISFAFVKDIVGSKPLVSKSLLLTAWIVWGLSITLALASFYFRQRALRKAMEHIRMYGKGPDDQPAGGRFSQVTAMLHILGGLLFLVGVVLIVFFASYNF